MFEAQLDDNNDDMDERPHETVLVNELAVGITARISEQVTSSDSVAVMR